MENIKGMFARGKGHLGDQPEQDPVDHVEHVSNLSAAPRENQVFADFNTMHSFLRTYAIKNGFKLIRKETRKNKDTGLIQYGVFLCANRAGHGPITCSFMIRFTLKKTGYVLLKVHLEHSCARDLFNTKKNGKIYKTIEQQLDDEEISKLKALALSDMVQGLVRDEMRRCFPDCEYSIELVRYQIARFKKEKESPPLQVLIPTGAAGRLAKCYDLFTQIMDHEDGPRHEPESFEPFFTFLWAFNNSLKSKSSAADDGEVPELPKISESQVKKIVDFLAEQIMKK